MTPIKRAKLKSAFIDAFQNSAGNVSIACKHIGISRNTFYEWKKSDQEFSESVEEIEEGIIDTAETMLYKAIREGKTAELIFFLKTKGKKRGYIERIETEDISDREPIRVDIVMPNRSDENEDTSND
jgi:hypothetical protein